jgi:hypothetical protein
MKKVKEPLSRENELRRRAESLLKKVKYHDLHGTHEDMQRLVHELQVHQIELEIQNEELLRARDEADAGLAKFADLYDFAPVGYFTFNRMANILQVNLTGALLLGAERSRLVKRRFDSFIADKSRPVFNAFLARVFAGQDKQSCEISLLKEEKPLFVSIEAVAADSGEECRLSLWISPNNGKTGPRSRGWPPSR